MKILTGIRRAFRISTFRADPEEEVESEISLHLRLSEEDLIQQGFSPVEAHEEACRRFGDLAGYRRELVRLQRGERTRSTCRTVLEAVAQDLTYVARSLRREPGFAAAVVLTLALGIGANTTMFGVVDHLILSPPAHVTDPDDVVRLQVHRISPFTGQPATMAYQTFPDYQDFLAADGLESVAAYGDQEVILGRGETAARARALYVTASYFDLLGVPPASGRFFSVSDDGPAAVGAVVLGFGLWQTRYGGDRSVLGSTLSIGDGSYTVVGIAPEGFHGVDLTPVDLFLPLHAYTTQSGSDRWIQGRGYYWLQILARLGPGVSREAVADEATALHLNGRREFIEQGRYTGDPRIVLGSVKAALGPDAPEEIQVSRWLVGVTLIVLLIACANVANLLLARGARRRRELGVRVALGIARRRLLGQLLLESLVLSGLGGAVGLALAVAAGRAVRAIFLPDVAWPAAYVDGRVLLFTSMVAMATGLLAGMAPAFRGADESVARSLREGGRWETGGRGRWQASLLIAQAALSVVLLVGAGLFVRSLHRAQSLDLGLDPEGLIVARMDLEGDWDPTAEEALGRRAIQRLERMPGVASASMTTMEPFLGMAAFEIFVPGLDSIPVPRGLGPFVTGASPNYLQTLGIELRAGRVFTDAEVAAGTRVAVVTENMANGLWPSGSALGACFKINDPESECWEVIGIAEDSHLTSLTGVLPWQYYVPLGEPFLSEGMGPGALLIRARSTGGAMLSSIRGELRDLDPGIRFAQVRLLQDLIDPQLRAWRLGAGMFSIFGGLALLVAAFGLYSLLAFNVARRTRELGIRSAVGATRSTLLGMVLRQAVGVTGIGIFLGLAVATLAAGKMGPLLFGTSPRDPLVLAGVAGVLLLVALAAGSIPSWAAARVDPMKALRTE